MDRRRKAIKQLSMLSKKLYEIGQVVRAEELNFHIKAMKEHKEQDSKYVENFKRAIEITHDIGQLLEAGLLK